MTPPPRDSSSEVPDARALLQSLVGREIRTVTGRVNRVLRVEGGDVIVATAKSVQGKPVPIRWVQEALDTLHRAGEIEISVDSVGYRSAFIGAVLASLPGAERVEGASPPRLRLARSRRVSPRSSPA